jgi:hypothetical protein
MPKLLRDDANYPIPQLVKADGNFVPARGSNEGAMLVTGDKAKGEADDTNPVKIGGKAVNPSNMPTGVNAGTRVEASFDPQGRLIVRTDIAPPLPTGAATSDKQDTINTSINNVNSNITDLKGKVATEATLNGVKTALNDIKGIVATEVTLGDIKTLINSQNNYFSQIRINNPLVTGKKLIGTSAVELFAKDRRNAERYRFKMIIYNESETDIVYIGGELVTADDGFPILPKQKIELDFNPNVYTPVYAIADVADVPVRIIEMS